MRGQLLGNMHIFECNFIQIKGRQRVGRRGAKGRQRVGRKGAGIGKFVDCVKKMVEEKGKFPTVPKMPKAFEQPFL